MFLSILSCELKGRSIFLHPHYFIYKCFPYEQDKIKFVKVQDLFYVYSDSQPEEYNDIYKRISILYSSEVVYEIGNQYSFVIKLSQSIKHNNKRVDYIKYLRDNNKLNGNITEIRIKKFKDVISAHPSIEINDAIIYNKGAERVHQKNIYIPWVEFRGVLTIVDPNFIHILKTGLGPGKSYGLGFFILGGI